MITLENRFFPLRSATCFVIEGGIILLSVLASFVILHSGASAGSLSMKDAIVRGILVAFFCQSCMYVLDLYDLKHSHSLGEVFFSLIYSVGIVCIGIGLVSFAVPVIGIDGNMYYLTILFVAVLLFLWRIVFDMYLTKFAPKQNVLIVGTGNVARMVAQEITMREKLGFKLLGFLGPANGSNATTNDLGKIVGSYEQVRDAVEGRNVGKIVVAINERRGEIPVSQMLALKVQGYQVVEWPQFFERLAGRIPIDSLAPSFFIFNEGFRKSRIVLVTRRVISFCVALMGLLVLSPALLAVSIMIRLDSPGSVFYRQERVGMNGKVFSLIKFRSMIDNAEESTGPRWAQEDDPRITRVGKWIRRFRIDEFPQLLNVLKGDLDLVGPRPERTVFVEQLKKLFPYYSLRHTIRPGVTGWAQVMFSYCGTVEESKEKLQYDLFYVKNMSVKLDILILVRTLKILLLGRGAR